MLVILVDLADEFVLIVDLEVLQVFFGLVSWLEAILGKQFFDVHMRQYWMYINWVSNDLRLYIILILFFVWTKASIRPKL